jgi:hypothetical protein
MAATAGFAEKGPIGEPTLIISKENYIQTFGEPIEDNYYMGMFADKFLDVSNAYFTRVAKEKDYEAVVSTVVPDLDFTSKPTPEFWIELADFPVPNNGMFRISFAGGSELADLDALITELNNAFSSVTLPDGTSTLDSYLTAEKDEDDETLLSIRSDFHKNVRITIHASQDTTNNAVGTTGTGIIGIEDGSSSEDVGAYAYAFNRIPVNPVEATNASITSSSAITQEQLNQISAFNLINLKIDGDTTNPFREYEDLDITPAEGTAATFPEVQAPNTPNLSADLSVSAITITISGFYDFVSGDGSTDINTSFTITSTLTGTQTSASDIVSDLNTQLAGVTTTGGTLDQYIQFAVYDTDKITLVNGTDGLANFGSQCQIEISGTIVTEIGYTDPTSATGGDSTYSVSGVAEKLNLLVVEAQITASTDLLTFESNTLGGTSFIEINEATTAVESALAILNFTDGDSDTGDNASNDGVVNIVCKDPGTWGNRIKVRTYTTTNPVTSNTIYNLEVYEDDESVEVFNNINWIDSSSDNFIVNLLEDSDYIRVDFGETLQYPNADTASAPTSNPPSNSDPSMPEYWVLSNGSDGIPTNSTEIDALVTEALDDYNDKEQYIIDLILAPGFTGTPVVSKLVSIGEARRDLLALVDPPSFLTWQEIIQWHNGEYSMGMGTSVALNSSYTVATWGWQKDFDPYNANYVDLPPSIYEAVAIASTAANYELWEAPAGPLRGVVNSISSYTKPNQEKREYLYNDVDPACINPIVQFPNKGTLIYGQKTCLRLNKAMNRINVVRLVNHISRNVQNIADGYIFELNNASTWAAVSRNLNAFLGNIAERGGLQDYQVIFDASTNTPDRIDQGIMYGQVYIQPVKVAERIFIDITIQRTGASVSV